MWNGWVCPCRAPYAFLNYSRGTQLVKGPLEQVGGLEKSLTPLPAR